MDPLDEIRFWSVQLSEHALFLYLGIVDPKLKDRAMVLHQAWDQFVKDVGKDVAYAEARSRALALAMDLRALKLEVLRQQRAGVWLGWLFPTFVDHTRRELDFFIRKLTGGMGMDEEVCIWLRFMAEHAVFAAHLLDPQEVPLIRNAAGLVGYFLHVEDGCGKQTLPALIELGKHGGRDLDEYFQRSGIGTPKVKSVIHPALAAHVVREGQRFLQTMDRMMSTVGPGSG